LFERFEDDLPLLRVEVVLSRQSEFVDAQILIERYGFEFRLRTLDTLQLAVAVRLRREGSRFQFVAADKALCDVARLERFSVVNPEEIRRGW
jgi:hypothetical protein